MQTGQNQPMQPDEINKLLVEKLMAIFTIVNDWLKYAEAKNAATLTFCGVAITVIVTYLSAVEIIFDSLRIGLIISICFFFISTVLTIVSFLPKTDSDKYFWALFHKSKNMSTNDDTDIFYFFNDLRKYVNINQRKPSAEKLINAIVQAYFPQVTLINNQIPNLDSKEPRHLCIQIINNSDIAFQKFILSGWSIRLALAAMLVIPLCMLLSLIIFHHL